MRPSVSTVWTAKRLSVVLMSAAIVVLLAGVAASAEGDPYSGDHTGDALIWQHASTITMNETITPIGGGRYRYAFSFVNTENAPIWELAVYIGFAASSPTPLSKTGWLAAYVSLNSVYPAYDARNVDPSLVYLVGTFGPGSTPTSTNPIAVGESVSGFSFTSLVYDSRPLLYQYNVQGNYPPTTGYSTAAGYTVVPEPSSLLALLVGSGAFGGLMWKRRR